MKLIRWVEVHIGRSRRKVKKDQRGTSAGGPSPDGGAPPTEGTLPLCAGTPTPAKKQGSLLSGSGAGWRGGHPADRPLVTSSPLPPGRGPPPLPPGGHLPEVEEDSLELMDGSSGSQPGSLKRLPPHIRTSFAQEAPDGVAGSPRQRSRIRTNPWLPSPRSSCSSSASGDSGLGARSSSADSPEPPFTGGGGSSVFGSSQVLAAGGGNHNPSSHCASSTIWPSVSSLRSEAPRSLERSRGSGPLLGPPAWTEPPPRRSTEGPRSRSLPRGATAPPHWGKACPLAEGDSSDEAYSEDFVQSEEAEEDSDRRISLKTLVQSPDSACAVSCGSTPLSEGTPAGPPQPAQRQTISDEPQAKGTPTAAPLCKDRPTTPKDLSEETLDEKVRRLRVSHRRVGLAMREARQDDQRRREERLLCQQELLRCRRLLLLKTLHELRTRLELQGHRLQRAYSATLEMRHLALEDKQDERLWDSFE